ncbi:MAG: KOW domain-containing RNA-binding protein [Synergistaceae bacterium]|nr:KOW domain-containing RNA-binding protein [Synergistaceae bacterium]
MDKSDGVSSLSDVYPLGQVVLSRRGKDRGTFYVVVGFEGEGRLALADAGKFNVSRPKRKNPRHVQATSRRAAELAGQIEMGKDIDRGRLCQVLAGLRNAPEN